MDWLHYLLIAGWILTILPGNPFWDARNSIFNMESEKGYEVMLRILRKVPGFHKLRHMDTGDTRRCFYWGGFILSCASEAFSERVRKLQSGMNIVTHDPEKAARTYADLINSARQVGDFSFAAEAICDVEADFPGRVHAVVFYGEGAPPWGVVFRRHALVMIWTMVRVKFKRR